MIRTDRKEITGISRAGRAFSAVMHMGRTVWSLVRAVCCFDAGYWRKDKTWNNDKPFKHF